MNRREGRRRPDWLPGPGLFFLWAGIRVGLLVVLGRLGTGGDGVMPLVFGWVQEMLAGESPYHERGVAYPPFAMFLFALIGVGEEDSAGYAQRFAAAMLVVDFLGLCLAVRADNGGRRYAAVAYVLVVACVGPILLLWRYDLIPAVCHLAAGVFLCLNLRRLSWAALGLGIAAKPYLLVALPFWVIWDLQTSPPPARRRVIDGIGFAFLPSLVAAVAMLPLSGLGFLSSYTFQTERGLQVESGPAVALAELAIRGGSIQEPVFSQECLCWERTGPSARIISASTSFLAVGGLVFLVMLVWHRETTGAVLTERVLLGSCAAVVLISITYRVFSPQYLVWALVPLALVAGIPKGAGGAALVGGAGLAAVYMYPFHYDQVINHSGVGRWLMLGRTAALVLAFFLLLPVKPKPVPFRR